MQTKLFRHSMLLVLGLVVSCSSLGQQYTPVKEIPEGKALVYIFFPGDQKPGRGPDFIISAAEKPIVKMEKGGYFVYFADPGELKLTSKLALKLYVAGLLNISLAPTESINLTIDPGRIYYLEGVLYYKTVSTVPVWGLRFNQILDEFQAQLILEECQRLPKYATPKQKQGPLSLKPTHTCVARGFSRNGLSSLEP
jgi:hypothetical protein